MDKIKQLKEQQARVWEQTKDLLNRAEGENRNLHTDEEEQYNRLNADLDGLQARISRLEKFEGEISAPADIEVKAAEAPDFKSRILNLRAGEGFTTSFDKTTRAQSVGTDSAGGYTSSDSLGNKIIQSMLQYSGMFQNATIFRTSRGEAIEFPTNNDTGNSGALLAENTQDSTQDLTFGVKTLNAYKYTSKIVLLSKELLQDSEFNLIDFVSQQLGTRLGRALNTSTTTGDGSSKPNGIVTAAAAGKTAASTSAITFDELIDLMHSVDPAYRAMGGKFMFNDSTLAAIRKLKDSNNMYLWSPGQTTAGAAGTILGVPYVVNNDMASIGSGNKCVLFGDFSKYTIRMAKDIELVRMNERYADYHQVGLVAIARWDGELLDTGAVKYLRNTTT